MVIIRRGCIRGRLEQLLPLDQVEDKPGNFRTGEIGFEDGLLLLIFLMAKVTLTMKQMMRLRNRATTANCARALAFFSPRTLGLFRMQRSSLAEELVLSEALRRDLIF